MFSNADLDAIRRGDIDLAFRRWKRRMHTPGGRQRTSIGVVGFGADERVALREAAPAHAEVRGPSRTSS